MTQYLFPQDRAQINENGKVVREWREGGATLHDFFWGLAMIGLVSAPGSIVGIEGVEAKAALIADRMMAVRAEREKRGAK